MHSPMRAIECSFVVWPTVEPGLKGKMESFELRFAFIKDELEIVELKSKLLTTLDIVKEALV